MFIEKYRELKKTLNDDQSLRVRGFCVSRRSLEDIGQLRKRGLVYYSSELCQGFICPWHCGSRTIRYIMKNKGSLSDSERDELIEILKAPPMLCLNANSNGPKQFDFADRLLKAGARFSFCVIRDTYKATKTQWWTNYQTIKSEEVISFDNFDAEDSRLSKRHCDLYEKWLKTERLKERQNAENEETKR